MVSVCLPSDALLQHLLSYLGFFYLGHGVSLHNCSSKAQPVLLWKTQQWPQDWKRSVFIPIPKKGNAKECSNYRTIALISQASKIMLKILQARLQQYANSELPVFKLILDKQRNQRSNCQHLLDHGKSKRVPEKHLFLFLTMPKP